MPQPAHGPPARTWLRARIASFGFALRGARVLIATQPHARFHLVSTVLVAIGGWWCGLARWEWISVALAAGGVWTAEALNTALEWLVDLAHPEWAEPAGRIKDVAAAAVLLAALAAAAVGVLVFGPRALAW